MISKWTTNHVLTVLHHRHSKVLHCIYLGRPFPTHFSWVHRFIHTLTMYSWFPSQCLSAISLYASHFKQSSLFGSFFVRLLNKGLEISPSIHGNKLRDIHTWPHSLQLLTLSFLHFFIALAVLMSIRHVLLMALYPLQSFRVCLPGFVSSLPIFGSLCGQI